MRLIGEQWVAYLDESQQRDHYFVAAALGPVSQWDLVGERLAELRTSAAQVYQAPPDAEFHGYPLMNGKDDWTALRGRHREEKQLQDRLVQHHRVGTQGYRSSRLDHICEPMRFCSSSTTDGLQVVDLALYIMQRDFHVPMESHAKAQAGKKRLVDKLKPRVEHFHVWRP